MEEKLDKKYLDAFENKVHSNLAHFLVGRDAVDRREFVTLLP